MYKVILILDKFFLKYAGTGEWSNWPPFRKTTIKKTSLIRVNEWPLEASFWIKHLSIFNNTESVALCCTHELLLQPRLEYQILSRSEDSLWISLLLILLSFSRILPTIFIVSRYGGTATKVLIQFSCTIKVSHATLHVPPISTILLFNPSQCYCYHYNLYFWYKNK